MRIGMDARLLHYQPAGIGLYTQRLLEALETVDQTNDYFVLQSRKDVATLARGPRFRRQSLWTPPHHRLEQWTLPLELAPLGLDLLHSPDFIPPLRWRGRSVITVMDLAFLRYPYLLTEESRRYYGQVGRAVARADAILAISQATRSDLVELLGAPEDKITVTYLAADARFRRVDDPAALAAVRRKHGLDGDYLLFVGTLEPRKDLPTLLRAFGRIRPGFPGLTLAMAGRPGWLCDEVYATARELGLEQAARFLGGVAPDDLAALYSGATAFVLPSLYEGFGMPVLESMACGTAVVCSNTSSLPEVAGDAALLFPPGDVDALAEALQRVITDETLRGELSRRGLARVARFSWADTARRTLAVYESLN